MNFSRRDYLILATAVVIVGLALRLVYFFSFHPPLIPYEGDSPVYDLPAWNVVQGLGYTLGDGEPFAGREPGYALFFLVPTYFLFGHNLEIVALGQAFLDVITLFIIIVCLWKHLRPELVVTAGLLYISYFSFIAQSGEILTETVYTFFLVLIFLLLVTVLSKPQWWKVLLVGLFVGMATLVRWGTIIFPVFMTVLFFVQHWQQYWPWKRIASYSLLVFLTTILVISPWVIRNYQLFDRFIFGRIGGGEIYWSGSYIPFDGEWPGTNAPELVSLRHGLNPLEADKKFTQLTIDYIKANPLEVAWVWLKKPYKIFLLPEGRHFLNQTGSGPSASGSLLVTLTVWADEAYHMILLFAAVITVWKRRLPIFIICACITFLLFSILLYLPLNPTTRYNLPLMPFIIIMAAPTVLNWIQKCYAFSKYVKKHF